MAKTGNIPVELKCKSTRGAKLIDLTGMKFGKWKVIRFLERINKQYRWLCECDCGTIRQVCGVRLRNGTSKSCGCIISNKLTRYFEESRKEDSYMCDELE